MKLSVFLVTTFMMSAIVANGQMPQGDLYWVVESNRNVPARSIVRLYDRQNELVHEVTLNTTIDITKRRHRKAVVQVLKRYSSRESAAGKKIRSKSSV